MSRFKTYIERLTNNRHFAFKKVLIKAKKYQKGEKRSPAKIEARRKVKEEPQLRNEKLLEWQTKISNRHLGLRKC